jgi:hypothetical protein
LIEGILTRGFQIGDSVTAIKLVSAARREKLSLTVLDIFRNPKLSDMATVCGVLKEDSVTELKDFSLLGTSNVELIIEELVEQVSLLSYLFS